MEKYSYQDSPLLGDKFRIMELLSPQHGSEVKAKLHTTTIDRASEGKGYEALSYCWGSEEDGVAIEIGGRPHEISPALASALRHLRLDSESRYLWIDQICINQANVDEKNHQVQNMMAEIYANTRHLIIWLGEDGGDSELACDTINQIGDMIKPEEQNNIDTLVGADLSRVLTAGQRIVDLKPWMAIIELLKRPWFERTWVVQELCLPKTDNITVHCGINRVAWWKLTLAHVSILRHDWRTVNFERHPDMHHILNITSLEAPPDFIRRINKISREQQLKGMSTLLGNLWAFINRQCSNKRDKVFAIKHISDDRVAQELRIDYDMDVESVFTVTARQIISIDRNLKILGACQLKKNLSGLPSWVPDWTVGQGRRPMRMLTSFGKWTEALSYRALPECEALLSLSDNQELLLSGYRIEKVSRVSADRASIYTSRTTKLAEINSFIREAWAMTGRHAVPHLAGWPTDVNSAWSRSDPKRVFFEKLEKEWATIFPAGPTGAHDLQNKESGLDFMGLKPDPVVFGPLVAEAWKFVGRVPPRTDISQVTILAALTNLLPPELDPYPEDDEFWTTLILSRGKGGEPVTTCNPKDPSLEYYSALTQSVSGRKFFVTTTNGSFGLGPYDMQEDDIICLFPGAVVPFVLRRRPEVDGWTLVGECYCNGYMDGARGERIVKEGQQELFCIK